MAFLHRHRPSFAVIGAGNGGTAMAAHLAINGFRVNLYNRTAAKLTPIREQGGIKLTGVIEGFGPLNVVSGDLPEVLDGVDIIMVVTPAPAHQDLAMEMAPYLSPEQTVILNPGRTGGTLEFSNILRFAGKDNVIAETQTFIYASRIMGPAHSHIFKIKKRVGLAAFPAEKTREVMAKIRQAYPQFASAEHVLETGLNNIGAIFHPAPLLMNAVRVDGNISFDYYHEGITPSIARIMERIDRERLAVIDALQIKGISARLWLQHSYGARGRTLYEAIHNTTAYAGITAPGSLDHRYIHEDVPTGLVPIASFGKHLGVETPAINSVIQLASIVHNRDYNQEGRTIQTLGLADMSISEIHYYLKTGRHPDVLRRHQRQQQPLSTTTHAGTGAPAELPSWIDNVPGVN